MVWIWRYYIHVWLIWRFTSDEELMTGFVCPSHAFEKEELQNIVDVDRTFGVEESEYGIHSIVPLGVD